MAAFFGWFLTAEKGLAGTLFPSDVKYKNYNFLV
jgi:hypothetical protein